MANEHSKLGFKNPKQCPDIKHIVLADFLEYKIIQLFQGQQAIHQHDLTNLFFQKVRFKREFFLAAMDSLIEKGIIIRQPKSSYMVLHQVKEGNNV